MNREFKNIQYLLCLLFFVFASDGNLFSCDMIAMIARYDFSLDFNNQSSSFLEPYDYFNFIQERSSLEFDHDGYGILYYKSLEDFYYNASNPQDSSNQAWYQYGLNTYYTHAPVEFANDWQWEMEQAIRVLRIEQTTPKIVLAHARKGTGGEGNHPFRFRWKNKTYSFMHNGKLSGIKQALFEQTFADSNWRLEHPSNWAPANSENSADYVDSEVFFHWLMKNILELDGSVLGGLRKSLTTSIPGLESPEGNTIHNFLNRNILNFVFCDGDALYLFRGTALNGNSYNLSFKKNFAFWAVKTQDNQSGVNLRQYDLVCLSHDTEPLIIPNFSNSSDSILAFEHRNYPNPFNSATNIEFKLQSSSNVKIIVFNSLGQKISQHDLGLLNRGLHTFKWNNRLNSNINLASGIYYYRIKTDNESVISSMLLIK